MLVSKKLSVILIIGTLFFCTVPFSVHADTTTEPFKAPQLSVPIPGMEPFKDIPAAEKGGNLAIPWLAQYIAAGYKYFVGIAVILAIVLMMIGGFQWMTSGGNSEGVSSGKKRITHAVLGLGLALGSYTILYTINPDLVELNTLNIRNVSNETNDDEQQAGTQGGSGTNNSTSASPATGKGKVASSSKEYIGSTIGNKQLTNAPCTAESAQELAKLLVEAQVCVGPCHCARTATHFLNYLGCGNPIEGMAGTSVRKMEDFGWISARVKGNPSVPMGLLWTGGHDGVSLGNGKVFESGPNSAILPKYGGSSCSWFVGDDFGTNKCKACEKLAGHGPSSGLYAPSQFLKPIDQVVNKKGEKMTVTPKSGCVSNQVWYIGPQHFTVVVYPPRQGETIPPRGCCKWTDDGKLVGSFMSQLFCEEYNKSKENRPYTWDKNIAKDACK